MHFFHIAPYLIESRYIINEFSYRKDPKFSDRYAWANSADLEEQSDKGLHCLPFRLHRLDSLHYSRARTA